MQEAAALGVPYYGTVKRYALDWAARAALPVAQEALKSTFGYGRPGYAPRRTAPRYSGSQRFDYSKHYLGRSRFRNPSLQKSGYFGGGEREAKFHDTSDTNLVSNVGQIEQQSFVQIASGVTECDRIGRRITVTELDIRMHFEIGPAGSLTNDCVRTIVYIDKQANGATAAVTDILETTQFFSHLNLSNMDRFTILEDHSQIINAQTGGVTAAPALLSGQAGAKHFFRIPMKLPIEYSGTTALITDVSSNNIGMLLIAKHNVLTDFHWNARVRFMG